MFLVTFLGTFWSPNWAQNETEMNQNAAQNANSISDRFFEAFMVDFWLFFCFFWNIFRHEFLQGGKDATSREHRPCRVDLRFTDGIINAKSFFLKKTVPKIGLGKYVFLSHILDHILDTFRAHLPPKTSKKTL